MLLLIICLVFHLLAFVINVKPLPISTLFIVALLAVIEPLAKLLPVQCNTSVAVVDALILIPLAVMLFIPVPSPSPTLTTNCVFAL